MSIQVNLDTIDNEIVTQGFFSFFKGRELAKIEAVCRSWREMVKDTPLLELKKLQDKKLKTVEDFHRQNRPSWQLELLGGHFG